MKYCTALENNELQYPHQHGPQKTSRKKKLTEKFTHHDSIKVQKQAILITYYLDYLGIHSQGL